MEYRRLGRSGLQVSALSFGSWVSFGNQLDVERGEACMVAAYDAGVNFFDNAEAYAAGKSETIMGEILQRQGWARDSFIVSSKVYWGGSKPTQRGLSRKHIYDACHAAMNRLQVDYLDLYFCHRPDPNTPIEETVWAMNDLIRQGKVLYWGTSEWSAQQIMEAHMIARQYNLLPPTMEQPQYHMFHRERVEVEYARVYREVGLGTTIWSPLASGVLTGKYNDEVPDDSRVNLPGYEWLKEMVFSEEGQARIQKVRELTPIADELGVSMAQLAIAWCLKNPNVSTVITGASRVSQVEENMKAMAIVEQLDDDVMAQIEAVLDNKPEPGAFQL
ncbi:MAG: aldo/keto reductase [Anaerolineae bacterium]|nr:aldo/keto reductase [Anaerolineae bacterium]MCO5189835.1 aldo/keto reductase [Anaerolineae bacterium]MCO5195575.1 aldo/keto reductase [Anaerolineae bacterium]MCO5198564.1 aldo/keto reductase [Anaerolineae bacterium]MCO5203508.1 aldo/keto reductase [Anaerolineae bacterium]